jgi:hypothetical protein
MKVVVDGQVEARSAVLEPCGVTLRLRCATSSECHDETRRRRDAKAYLPVCSEAAAVAAT